MGGAYDPGVRPEAFASMHLGREQGVFVAGGCLGGVVGVGCGRYCVMWPAACPVVLSCVLVWSCCGLGLARVVVFCCCGVSPWSSVGFCCGLLGWFRSRWRFCTSAVMIRCMVDARKMIASWIRVMTALVIA